MLMHAGVIWDQFLRLLRWKRSDDGLLLDLLGYHYPVDPTDDADLGMLALLSQEEAGAQPGKDEDVQLWGYNENDMILCTRYNEL